MDASCGGIGAVLAQKTNSKYNAIAFDSRVLTKAERNCTVTEQEALAIMWSFKHFRDIIYQYPVHVLTDHAPLIPLFQTKQPTGRLVR